MRIALHYAPTTCALVPYVNLTEAGADFEVIPVNFFTSQNMSPEYLKVTPLHKVPVLELNDMRSTENIASQIWMARAFPHARLLPTNAMQEIRAISLMGWFGSGIHPHLSRINSPKKFCDVTATEESVRRLAAKQIDENFHVVDQLLSGREFFFDHYTAPDIYFFWCFRRATQFNLPLSRFTQAAAHFERMRERPSVKKLLAFEAETIARMKQTI